jgi:large subunit ribosomal protein L19
MARVSACIRGVLSCARQAGAPLAHPFPVANQPWLAAMSTTAAASESAPSGDLTESVAPRVKHFSRWRRASAMMARVREDALDNMHAKMRRLRPELPEWNVGDAVEIEYAFERRDKNPTVIRGAIVGRRRKGLDASFTLLNEAGDDVVKMRLPLHTPLLRSMRVMRKNHVRDGKRVRRSQLTYLDHRPVSDFRVTVDTKEEWERALEAKIRRELQRSGKNWGKAAVAEEKSRIFRTGKGVVRVDATMDYTEEELQKATIAARSKRKHKKSDS